MAPSDPRVQAALDAIGSSELPEWPQVSEGHRQQLRSNPHDLSPLHHLFTLHVAGKRMDQALLAATLLVHFGKATDEEYRFWRELGPRGHLRSTRPLPTSWLEKLRHADDRSTVEALVACLSPLLSQLFPVSLEDVGSSEMELLAEIALPHPFSAVLKYVSQQLGTPIPPLYLSTSLKFQMVPLPSETGLLVVGHELVDSDDEARAAFVVARALSCMNQGRRHLFTRRSSELKQSILAILAFFWPETKIPDEQGQIARFQTALQASQVDKERLQSLVNQIVRQTKINLTEWRRAVHRTSARVGLLVCADPKAALQALEGEPEVAQDLVDFVLGETYANLRRYGLEHT